MKAIETWCGAIGFRITPDGQAAGYEICPAGGSWMDVSREVYMATLETLRYGAAFLQTARLDDTQQTLQDIEIHLADLLRRTAT